MPRSGQAAQAAPKLTVRLRLITRTCPAGQVAVPCSSSTVKSSTYPGFPKTRP